MVKMTLELTSEQLARLQTSVMSDQQRRLETIAEIEKRLEYWRAQENAEVMLKEDESNLEYARARVVIADDLLKLLAKARIA